MASLVGKMTAKHINLDPTKLVRDSAGIATLLGRKQIVSGWELIEIPQDYVFYKGLPMSDDKVLNNSDVSNVFANNHQWLGSPETCYLYAVRGLVNPTSIPPDRCVLGFRTNRPLLLYNLLSITNMLKMASLNIDTETKATLRIMTGVGYSGQDMVKLTGNRRKSPTQFTEAGNPVKYVIDGNIFGGDRVDFNRVSFYDHDVKIREVLNKYLNCDGYYGYPAPSLYHLNGVFPGEVCIFHPKYTLELDRNSLYSTTRSRAELDTILHHNNYSDRIAKLGADDVLVDHIANNANITASNIDHNTDQSLIDMIEYVLRMQNQIDIPEGIGRLNDRTC